MKDTSQRRIFFSHDYSDYTRMAQCYHLITFGETKHLIGKHDLSIGATQKRLEREGSRGCLQVPRAPHSLFQCPIIGIKWWGHCLPISKHRCLRLPLGTSGIRAWISTMDSRSQWLASLIIFCYLLSKISSGSWLCWVWWFARTWKGLAKAWNATSAALSHRAASGCDCWALEIWLVQMKTC